jgi:hypothetical protein
MKQVEQLNNILLKYIFETLVLRMENNGYWKCSYEMTYYILWKFIQIYTVTCNQNSVIRKHFGNIFISITFIYSLSYWNYVL